MLNSRLRKRDIDMLEQRKFVCALVKCKLCSQRRKKNNSILYRLKVVPPVSCQTKHIHKILNLRHCPLSFLKKGKTQLVR